MREIHRSPVNFQHKGQWRGALMFSLIYAWINDWVNNREAGDLRRQHGHYDVIVMLWRNVAVTYPSPSGLSFNIFRSASIKDCNMDKIQRVQIYVKRIITRFLQVSDTLCNGLTKIITMREKRDNLIAWLLSKPYNSLEKLSSHINMNFAICGHGGGMEIYKMNIQCVTA